MTFKTIQQKTSVVFCNIYVFLEYICDYLVSTKFFYPLCDDEDSLRV